MTTATLDNPTDAKALTRLTLIWVLIALALFPILGTLGSILRSSQGELIPKVPAGWFYAMMTLHGLGMVGLWFVAGMAGVGLLLGKYVRVGLWASRFAMGATLVGVGLLVVATLVGKLAVGWYFLYPLPFHSQTAWPDWATAALFVALGVMGVGWVVWAGDMLYAIARRYSLSSALGWPYLRGEDPGVPPVIIISTVAFISVLGALAAAVVMLVLIAVEYLATGVPNDALLMKNLTFYFGHVLVNITMYLGVAMVYEVLPSYGERPWRSNRLVAIAWNAALLLVAVAYLHHLYMDFAQPRWLQYVGQISSYVISIPAAVVTIFSTLVLVHGNRMRWGLVPVLLVLGVMGWAIGGVAAVIDSTVAVNASFHNTLWVPAHVHSYFLMGVVLMILGAVFHVVTAVSGLPENPRVSAAIVGLVGVGGWGFILTMFAAGADSVPRRFSEYPAEVAQGIGYAAWGAWFTVPLLVGALIYIWITAARCVKGLAA